MVRVADYIMQRLHHEGIRHIYTVTGRGALFLSDALAAHKGLTSISVHHEQSASFAAVADADLSGNLGACLVSTGCAGTNALTGVLNAWQDAVPCVFLSGQNKLSETSRHTGIPIRTYGQQEADIIPIVQSVTKYATMISDPKTIVFELEKALHLAQSGRKGPVWLDIPLDVQNMRVRPEELTPYTPDANELPKATDQELKDLVDHLNQAQRPVVLIGSGIRAAKAESLLKTFIENQSIPLIYSASAPDTYGVGNSLSIGSVGIMGCTRAGNFAMQNSDLVLALGCRLNSMIVGTEPDKFARDAKVVVVDIDKIEHSKGSASIDQLILSDVKFVLEKLLTMETNKTEKKWVEKCLHWKSIFPRCEGSREKSKKVDLYFLAEVLSKTLPSPCSLLTDSGMIELVMPNNVVFDSHQRCIHPASQGSMGYALPAVIGAHFSSQKPVIAVIGDGSILMNLQELITISYHNIPVKILVVNNNAYAVIRKRQQDLFGSRTIGTDPENGVGVPDFQKVAETFGLGYSKIETSKELPLELPKVFEMDGPVLCEIMGLEDQCYLHSSYTKNSKNRIVMRPLEDQSPFLDRELFLKEMLIDPIDQ